MTRRPSLPTVRAVTALAGALAVGLLVASPVLGWRQGPPADRVLACGFGPSCADIGCHDTWRANEILVPWTLTGMGGGPVPPYVPGRRYALTLRIDERPAPTAAVYGFEIAPIVECPSPVAAGNVTPLDEMRTRRVEEGGIVYLSHACTCPSESADCCGYVPPAEPGLIEWSFLWDAPPSGTGSVTFAMGLNASNWSGTREDDRITLASAIVSEDATCAPPIRDLRVTQAACDGTGLPALELTWTPSGAPFVVRTTTDVRAESPDRATWPMAGTAACVPLGPEQLLFFSVAENCGSGAEGAH